MKHQEFLISFQSGKKIKTEFFGEVTFITQTIGELVLTSGKLLACDPLSEPDTEPFSTKLPPGRYPVILSVASIQKNNERRVAYAMLRLSDRTAVRWELATVPGEDLNTLEEGEIFGYGVDSGTGCFMDADAAELLLEIDPDTGEDFADNLIEKLEKNRASALNWAMITLADFTEANLIAFDSGWGDGVYATYLGYDAQNKIVNVITDFELFGSEADTLFESN